MHLARNNFFSVKRLLQNVRIYAYAQKKYGYAYKILTLFGLFYIAFY